MEDDERQTGFATKSVHSGTNPIGDAVNTPVFLSSIFPDTFMF